MKLRSSMNFSQFLHYFHLNSHRTVLFNFFLYFFANWATNRWVSWTILSYERHSSNIEKRMKELKYTEPRFWMQIQIGKYIQNMEQRRNDHFAVWRHKWINTKEKHLVLLEICVYSINRVIVFIQMQCDSMGNTECLGMSHVLFVFVYFGAKAAVFEMFHSFSSLYWSVFKS